METDALSLAVNVFGVIGATDVVLRSVTGLTSVVLRVAAAGPTQRRLLSTLRDLASALSQVRAWAVSYEQSPFARNDGQMTPQELMPILQRCADEAKNLQQHIGYTPSYAPWNQRWYANARFAWNEATIRQSIDMLEKTKLTLLLLIANRARCVFLRHSTRGMGYSDREVVLI